MGKDVTSYELRVNPLRLTTCDLRFTTYDF